MIDNERCIDLLKEELNKKGELQLTVHGDSMLPNLKDGEAIIVEKCDKYKIGDIVAFYAIIEKQLKIVVHRVILVRKTYALTKGDNNNAENSGTINADLIEGKVIGKIPLLGKFFAKEIITIIVFIIGYFYIPKKKNKTNTTKNRYKKKLIKF